jgi:hypothetical protein
MAKTDKATENLRFAAASDVRAGSTRHEGLKALFLRIAEQYRDLALQIEDPEKWRARATSIDRDQCATGQPDYDSRVITSIVTPILVVMGTRKIAPGPRP